MQDFEYAAAQKMTMNYVCAHCWGELKITPAPDGKFYVVCRHCNDETPGYVTRYYVEKRKTESAAELADASKTLRDAGVLPKNKMTIEQAMKDLGF